MQLLFPCAPVCVRASLGTGVHVCVYMCVCTWVCTCVGVCLCTCTCGSLRCQGWCPESPLMALSIKARAHRDSQLALGFTCHCLSRLELQVFHVIWGSELRPSLLRNKHFSQWGSSLAQQLSFWKITSDTLSLSCIRWKLYIAATRIQWEGMRQVAGPTLKDQHFSSLPCHFLLKA